MSHGPRPAVPKPQSFRVECTSYFCERLALFLHPKNIYDRRNLHGIEEQFLPFSLVAVRESPAGKQALPDTLLPTLEQALDDFLSVVLSDGLANLSDQDIPTVLPVVIRHVGDEHLLAGKARTFGR